MKLAENTLTDFLGQLSSGSPAPGGGSAAALEGSLGTALISMVCALTRDNQKYAADSDYAARIGQEAQRLHSELTELADRDTLAFRQVSAAYAMPKGTPAETARRKEAIAAALRECTRVPCRVMELCGEALELASGMLGRFNTSAASDLGCAVLSLKAGIQGAWLNVLINTNGMGDTAFAAKYRKDGEMLLAQALPMADRAYAALLRSMK